MNFEVHTGIVLCRKGLQGCFIEWSLGKAGFVVAAEGGLCCISDVDSELLKGDLCTVQSALSLFGEF